MTCEQFEATLTKVKAILDHQMARASADEYLDLIFKSYEPGTLVVSPMGHTCDGQWEPDDSQGSIQIILNFTYRRRSRLAPPTTHENDSRAAST